MATPVPPKSLLRPLKHLQASDLRGAAQLAVKATAGVTQMVQSVHQAVWSTLGVAGGKSAGQTGGITGLVYQSVQGVTRLVGKSIEAALNRLQPQLEAILGNDAATPEREAVLAALNGVLGDHLAQTHNPLATAMTLRLNGQALNWQIMPDKRTVTGKVLLLVHGLCMNDLQWNTQPAAGSAAGGLASDANKSMGDAQSDAQSKAPSPARGADHDHGHDHGAALAAQLGYTPVYVRYNTGLHTSDNGHMLSAQLEQLAAAWPTPITELAILGHSMGGLVTRSAVQQAHAGGAHWPRKLKSIVFLGTPHHGAPLEKAGNWLDIILGSTPYSAPFAKLGQLRSAGITDLRYGHVQAADWQGRDRFARQSDPRQPLPLPDGVACYSVAATLAGQRSALAERIVGDGLVPLASAMGQHSDPKHHLVFAKTAQRIAYRTNHMQLLSSPAVTEWLAQWLAPDAANTQEVL